MVPERSSSVMNALIPQGQKFFPHTTLFHALDFRVNQPVCAVPRAESIFLQKSKLKQEKTSSWTPWTRFYNSLTFTSQRRFTMGGSLTLLQIFQNKSRVSSNLGVENKRTSQWIEDFTVISPGLVTETGRRRD